MIPCDIWVFRTHALDRSATLPLVGMKGFEPLNLYGTDFESVTFDHSVTSLWNQGFHIPDKMLSVSMHIEIP